jgi:hypothetical protein
MATINPSNPFISYILTPEETIRGAQLSLLQKQHIRNIIASYAQERLAREIDPSQMMATVQADAKNKGQIEALQYILDLSDAADSALSQSTAPQEG